ncbi:MAG TPA: response regulator [Nitrososphaeraceae archaeon]|jgi:CheY-like chemotaxis protein/predicted transcriptional regulator|nr:response regulator [Nitrososphaeraceae archaeon]
MAENLGSFSFDVTKRILCTLFNDGSLKKTTLATKTRLNYNVCLRYIQMLKVLGWINVSSEISITETGRNVMKRLLNQPSSDIQNNSSYDMSSNSSTLESDKKLDQAITHNQNIMIVDDESDVLLTYESFLSYAGFNVSTFADSYEALRDFASNPRLYDLVILDIRMENLNGLQLYQSMKAMNPSSKILFASALDAAKELTSILPDIESQDIIKKPVDRENFIKVIKMALGS